MHLDARKKPEDLQKEWKTCTRCELGQRRELENGKYVAGTGATRGIMLIGEGPGKQEEAAGIPFIGRSGQLLRKVLAKLDIESVCYITNIVTCRSCAQDIDSAGKPITMRVRGVEVPKYKDQPPSPSQIEACFPRLMEEIYLVDPLVIVSLGGTAASALLRRPVTILRESGQEEHITIPGVAQVPSITEKKGTWVRKVKGTWSAPTERNRLRYLLIPTLHPAYVARSGAADFSDSSPLKKFFSHLRTAATDYVRLAEYYSIRTTITPIQDANIDDVRFDSDEEEA